MKLYVDAINDPNSIPNVQTAWETHVQRKCKDAKRKALQAYDKKIKAQLSKLPCDGEKILASHESAIRQSRAIFNEETVGISADHIKRDFEELTVRKMPLYPPSSFFLSFLPPSLPLFLPSSPSRYSFSCFLLIASFCPSLLAISLSSSFLLLSFSCLYVTSLQSRYPCSTSLSFLQQNEEMQKLAKWKAKNDSLTKEACERLLKELKRKHLDPVFDRARGPAGASVSYKEIDDGLAIIELEYNTHAVGAKNVRAQVFYEFHEVLVKLMIY